MGGGVDEGGILEEAVVQLRPEGCIILERRKEGKFQTEVAVT